MDIAQLEREDWEDPQHVGGPARAAVAAALVRARDALEIARWLRWWSLEGARAEVVNLISALIETSLAALSALVLARTAVDDSAAAAADAETERLFERMVEQMEALEAAALAAADAPTPAAVARAIFGPSPGPEPADWSEVVASYRPTVNAATLRPSVERQLGPVIDGPGSPGPADIPGLFLHLVRAHASPGPILAVYSASLVFRLCAAADAADSPKLRSNVESFYPIHAGRINATRLRMGQYSPEDDLPTRTLKAIDDYKRLAEGMLRPFGTFVVAAACIAKGSSPPDVSDPPMLGEVEERLTATQDPAAQLLVGLLNREIRNSAAHDRVTVGADGTVTLENGDPISLEQALWWLAMLDSALGGVDLAIATYRSVRAWTFSASAPTHQTLGFLEATLRIGMGNSMGVTLESLEVRGQSLILTIRGWASMRQFNAFARRLPQLVPGNLHTVEVTSSTDDGTFVRRFRT